MVCRSYWSLGDFDHAYKTWDLPYMESVMWVFKQMYDKGYIYKGLKVSLYCPHDATPISNFEVAMDADNYKDVPDSATTYKYPLVGEDKTLYLPVDDPLEQNSHDSSRSKSQIYLYQVKQNGEFYILVKTI